MEIKELLQLAITADASDLHLTQGMPPILRVDGELGPIEYLEPLTKEEIEEMVYSILTEIQRDSFEKRWELDFSTKIPGVARFRVNVHIQKGAVEAAFRVIPTRIRSLRELGMPPIVAELTRRPNGLVLVTGPAGVGKSTTLAAMIELINNESRFLIVTIEDPIEYIFQNKKSIIKQREVGRDTKSFSGALKHILRQDPNVIMVGEMRDLETISMAVTAAETGHLVLSTLHTPDAPQTIDRLIDVFHPMRQQEIKTQLAGCLQGVISQQLLLRADGRGRVATTEVLVVTDAVRYCIKTHQTEQLPGIIQTGTEYGMRSMDKSLKELYQKKIITRQTAISRAKHIEEFVQI